MASVLETAGHVNVENVAPRHVSDPLSGVIEYGDASGWPDVRRIVLQWPLCPDSMKRAIWMHFEDTVGAFEYAAPDGNTHDVIYAEPPQFTRQSGTAGTVQVTLQEAMATD